jgi:hypothetical protein
MALFWLSLGIGAVFLGFWLIYSSRLIKIKNQKRSRQILANVISVIILIDYFCTLLGQSPQYWLHRSIPIEGNPLALFLLKIHPLVFGAGILVWILLNSFLISILDWFLSRLLFLVLYIGHSLAIFSWIKFWLWDLIYDKHPAAIYYKGLVFERILDYGYYFLIAIILLILIKKFFKQDSS